MGPMTPALGILKRLTTERGWGQTAQQSVWDRVSGSGEQTGAGHWAGAVGGDRTMTRGLRGGRSPDQTELGLEEVGAGPEMEVAEVANCYTGASGGALGRIGQGGQGRSKRVEADKITGSREERTGGKRTETKNNACGDPSRGRSTKTGQR